MAHHKSGSGKKGSGPKGKGAGKKSGGKGGKGGDKKKTTKKQTRPLPGKGKYRDTKPTTDREVQKPEDRAVKPVKRKRTPEEEEEAAAAKLPLSKKKKESQHFMNRLDNDHEFKMAQQAKIVWEKVRVKEMDGPARAKMINKLLAQLTGHIQALCLKHDASRIVQTCLKYGTKPQCDAICAELIGSLRPLCKSKYGKALVKKLLMYCTKDARGQIIKSELLGHVVELMTHKEAADIVDFVFTDIANADQRNKLVNELYGREFALYQATSGCTTLEQVQAKSPETMARVVAWMADMLSKMVDKGIVRHSLMHRCAADFFKYANTEQRTSFAGHVSERLLEMIHTRAGMLLGLGCVTYGTPKDRKQLVKSMKGYVSKVCTEEFGHLVLLKLLSVLDDTVLAKEALLKELCAEATELLQDTYTRRVLLGVLSGLNPRYLPGDALGALTAPVDAGVTVSKKSAEQRRAELLTVLLPCVLDAFQEAPALLLCGLEISGPGSAADLLFEAVAASEDAEAVQESLGAVAAYVLEIEWGVLEERLRAFGAVKRLLSIEGGAFAQALCAAMDQDKLVHYVEHNSAGYMLGAMLRSCDTVRAQLLPGLKKASKVLSGLPENTGGKHLADECAK